jgi:hypothetical protein
MDQSRIRGRQRSVHARPAPGVQARGPRPLRPARRANELDAQQLVAVVGGSFYVDCPIAVRVMSYPVIWFSRDEDGQVLVNLQQLTSSGEPRMVMLDNFWITEGSAEHDIQCPPSGRLVKASYPNGDRLKIEFRSHDSWEKFDRRYPPPTLPMRPMPPIPSGTSPEEADRMRAWHRERSERSIDLPPNSEHAKDSGLELPLTTVEVEMNIAGSELKLGPRSMTLPGQNVIAGGWMVNCGVGVQIGAASDAA